MDRRTAVALALLLLGAAASAGAQDVAPADSTDTDLVEVSFWPPELTTLGVVWTPQALLSSRVGLGLGAETLLAYRVGDHPATPRSTLSFYFLGTTKGQWRIHTANDLRWDGGRNYLRVRVDHDDLAREFHGLGPRSPGADAEVYRPQSTLTYVEWRHRVTSRFSVGPRIEVHLQAVNRATPGGLLDQQEVRGATRGWANGGGLVAGFDTRDCYLHTCRGLYAEVMALTFLPELGDHRFQVLNLDLRGYFPVGDRRTLAAQLFYYGVSGEPPFWRLASLGGRPHSRAYQRDRWLDEVLAVGQLEWRWRVSDRVGVVPFGGAAVVDRGPAAMRWDNLRPSVGLGLRWFGSSKRPEVPIRLDLAFGHRSWRLELAVGEAF